MPLKIRRATAQGVLDTGQVHPISHFPVFCCLWKRINLPPYPPSHGHLGRDFARPEVGVTLWSAHFLDFLAHWICTFFLMIFYLIFIRFWVDVALIFGSFLAPFWTKIWEKCNLRFYCILDLNLLRKSIEIRCSNLGKCWESYVFSQSDLMSPLFRGLQFLV